MCLVWAPIQEQMMISSGAGVVGEELLVVEQGVGM